MCVCIYPTSSYEQDETQGQFLTGALTYLNFGFSFSLTGCHTKVKEPSLTYYLTITAGRIIRFMPFVRVFGYVKCKQPRTGFELGSRCPFPSTITITSQASLSLCVYECVHVCLFVCLFLSVCSFIAVTATMANTRTISSS